MLLSLFRAVSSCLLLGLFATSFLAEGKAQTQPDGNWITDPHDKRVALVIGNADYHGTADDLTNPVNDARAVAAKLENMGYSVNRVENGGDELIRSRLDEFVNDAREAKLAFFFYAGHGVQVLSSDGSALRNQLLPTDYAVQGGERDSKMIDLAEFLRKLEATGVPTRILVLDACRNTPGFKVADSVEQHEAFEVDELDRRMATTSILRNPKTRSVRVRGTGETVASSGFGEMVYQPGTLVAYATGTGKVVPDQFGQSTNSPFTTALLAHIADPDRDVDNVLKRVNADVAAMSAKFSFPQTPLVVNALQESVFLVAKLPRSEFYSRVQSHLKIAGCYLGNPDGKWGKSSMRSLAAFKTMSKLSIDIENIHMGTLNAMRNYIATARFEFCTTLPGLEGGAPGGGAPRNDTTPAKKGPSGGASPRPASTPAYKPPVGNPYGGGGVGVPF